VKTAPSFVAGLTAIAALGAGALLAAEDRALFEPRQVLITSWVEDAEGLIEQAPSGAGGLLPVGGERRAGAAADQTHRPTTLRPGAPRSSAP
jgi:hypothetical protein